MKYRMIYCLILFLCIPGLSNAVSDVPRNVTLTATENTILVDWTGDADADEYIVYWGTVSDNLNTSARVDDSQTEYTITGLDSGSTYYVAVSSVDGTTESDKSDTKSITTSSDKVAPEIPEGLDVTSTTAITESSVSLKWNKNSESDLDHYNIRYGTSSGSYSSVVEALNSDASAFAVTGLMNAVRYYFTISAVDTAGNESDYAEELIVDTLVDSLPPNRPDGISGELSDINKITINVIDGNSQMADFAGNIIYYGRVSGSLDNQADIGKSFTFELSGLPDDSTWYFAALSYDVSGNESLLTSETAVVVEDIVRFLNQPDDFDGGCFIDAANPSAGRINNLSVLFLLIVFSCLALVLNRFIGVSKRVTGVMMICIFVFGFSGNSAAEKFDVPGNNMIGVSAGYFISAESEFEDFYGEDIFPVFAFYERLITKYISVDIESGFIKENGSLMTESGGKTGIDSDITLVPVSASLKINVELMPYVVGYFGAGPDYWYCQEETVNNSVHPEIEEWVGGYHGKVGLKLYNTDELYKNTGAIIETSYSQIDRFGDNKTDIGGWTFKFGIFYQF